MWKKKSKSILSDWPFYY